MRVFLSSKSLMMPVQPRISGGKMGSGAADMTILVKAVHMSLFATPWTSSAFSTVKFSPAQYHIATTTTGMSDI